jgi:hypothetical protein
MSEYNASAGSASSAPAKQFQWRDERKRAFEVLKKLGEVAQSKGLWDFVNAEADPIIHERPDTEEAGGTAATKAKFDDKVKLAEEQSKSIAAVMLAYREMISTEAMDYMLTITCTPVIGSLNPRDLYRKFKQAYCTLSPDEVYATQIALQTQFVLGTSAADHGMKHSTTRDMFELSGANTPQMMQVREFKLTLRALFMDNDTIEERMETEFIPHVAEPNAMKIYMMTFLKKDRDGAFRKQTDPSRLPSAKVNVVTEASRAKGASKPFLETSAELKKKYKDVSTESVCPHHKVSDSGLTHKWGQCSYYLGERRKRPNGK